MSIDHAQSGPKGTLQGYIPSSRLVRTHPVVRGLATLMVVSFCLTLLGMLFAPWQQTSSGTGQVVAFNPLERRQLLGAPIKGRILRWHVTEGSFVKKGQLIADMTDIDPNALSRIGQQRAAIREQIRLARRQAAAYASKMKSLNNVRRLHLQANQLKIQMTTQKYKASQQKKLAVAAELRTSLLNLKRLKRLKKDDIVSNRTLEVAELKVAKLRMELNVAKASVLAARSEIIETRAQRMKKSAEDQSKIDSADADYQKAMDKAASATNKLAKIGMTIARQASQTIRSPRDAVLLRLLVNEGSEMLKAGDPIAVLIPKTSAFAAEVWIDGNDLPLLKKGRHVRLQFEGWPAIQFMGWPSVAVGTFGGRIALVDATNHKASKFRILVVPAADETPWPTHPFLRQGMRAKAWILLDEVRIGYEIWRQLNGFPPTVTAPTKATRSGTSAKKPK